MVLYQLHAYQPLRSPHGRAERSGGQGVTVIHELVRGDGHSAISLEAEEGTASSTSPGAVASRECACRS